MRIRHATGADLELTAHRPGSRWFRAACSRFLRVRRHPFGRVLVAEEDGLIVALLGFTVSPARRGQRAEAIVLELEVDPARGRQGIGSRLVRFAEGIARMIGCPRLDVATGLSEWGEGNCWLGLGYVDDGGGLHKVLGPPGRRRCA